MKSIFAFACVIVLLCSFCIPYAICEQESSEADPIIGCWYIDMELIDEITISGYEDYIRFVQILSFEENGTITRFEIDYAKGKQDTVGPANIGKWERISDSQYSLSIVALGTEKAFIVDGDLYAIGAAKDMYYCYHKMINFDWYNDMYSK